MRPQGAWTVLAVAHGSVEHEDQIPEFLTEIRRGRPPPSELIEQLRLRYRAIGGSPHLRETEAQAGALERRLGMTVRVAMRLSPPRVSDILAQFDQRHRICLVPLAPFSVHVYEAHARACLAGQADPPQLACVAPWGREPSLSAHWVREIQQALLQLAEPSRCQLILTAHSLPTAVLASGDPYREQFEAAATSIAEKAGDAAQVAYQSQGQGGGAWLGPTLLEAMTTAAAAGKTSVLIAPVGFMAEHLETLYDLDIEARAQAQRLGLVFARLRAPGTADGLIEALATAARQAMNTAAW